MSTIPVEVLGDILCRLPVEPLLRFRCVSPVWRDLIDSDEFVKLHLNRSTEKRTNFNLILRSRSLQSAKFDSSDCSLVTVDLDHHPLRCLCLDFVIKVCGSVNGLLCLSDLGNVTVLWNPASRKSVKLPYAPIEYKDVSMYITHRVLGFGYDAVSDDYKVVRIVIIKGSADDDDFFDYEVKVYSLKSNSWHRAEKFPHLPHLRRESGRLACGALHWIVEEKRIVAFDLGVEKFRIVPGPKLEDVMCHASVECFEGSISLVCYHFLRSVDVWVMRDYGVEESWTKMFSANQYMIPVDYPMSSGEVLLQHDGGLVWYDIESKTIKKVKIRGVKELLQVEMCMETLVPLSEKKQEKKEEDNPVGFLSKGFKLVL